MNPPSTSAQPAAAVSTVFFCKQGDISEERNSYYLQQTLVIQYMQKNIRAKHMLGGLKTVSVISLWSVTLCHRTSPKENKLENSPTSEQSKFDLGHLLEKVCSPCCEAKLSQ